MSYEHAEPKLSALSASLCAPSLTYQKSLMRNEFQSIFLDMDKMSFLWLTVKGKQSLKEEKKE